MATDALGDPSTGGKAREPYDIYIVGLGIIGVRHVTREAEQCIRQCRRVFLVDHGVGVREYVESLGPPTESLLGEYHEGESRLGTYKEMSARVVEAALGEGPVCFATYGHPMMYV